MFGREPRQCSTPLDENDHPELDQKEFLDEDNIEKYQSLIGALQWIISIGRFDIQTAVMTMSSFRAQPQAGHLERLKKIYGYLSKFRDFKLRFHVEPPDFSQLDTI